MATGYLKVQVFENDSYVPIDKAKVTITPVGAEQGSSDTIQTNSSGVTDVVELDAPPIAFSQRPSEQIPYSFSDVMVEAEGYAPQLIKGVQIYPEITALQQLFLKKDKGLTRQNETIIIIQPNVLVGNYPPKIPEEPIKPMPKSTGQVVLPNVVVPEFIIVHDGGPNSSGPNYTVPFPEYVKNVASSEIYSTWPENTIRANVNAIVSFTLNRIYTEWYPSRGKDFDITNSTAYDHAFSYGRNVYENISRIVDDLFTTYIKRSGVRQPLLTQYCDGVQVQCPGWMTQWGSKYLGDQGKTPYEILTNYYGNDINLVTAEEVEGIPRSYPGYTLEIGSTGQPVITVQTYLNRISQNYPLIPKVRVDGIYGNDTKESVKVFQGIFGLSQTGNVDYATWYKLSQIYVGVTKIAELRGHEEEISPVGARDFYPPLGFGNHPLSDVPKIKYWDDL